MRVILFFTISLVVLSIGAGAPQLATSWVDPVAKTQAQDEAVYAASSLGMARGEGWLTPKFMGRYALYKPPMLYWLSGASVKLFGESNLALRLPSLAAGAGMATVVFVWVSAEAGLWAGLAGAVLLLSNHLIFMLSRMALTDALLAFFTLLAMFAVARDPALATRRGLWIFAGASGAAILTKSVAGVIPILAALVLWAESRRWPERRRMGEAVAITVVVGGSWHFYQLVVHPHWFWAEYVQTELFAGTQQVTGESVWGFYGRRLVMLDPFLLVAAVVGAWRRRSLAVLALLQVMLLVLIGIPSRNASYLMPVFGGMAILAARGIPGRSALAGALVIAALKIAAVPATWALPYGPETANPSYEQLRSHTSMQPDRELIIGEPDDQFYAATLGAKRLRYVYRGESPGGARPPLDFEQLGILLTVPAFDRIGELTEVYRRRLRAFDLDSPASLGSVILASDDAAISHLLAARPGTDFYVPERWVPLDHNAHLVRPGAPGRMWLEGRH